jgi:HK97 family phage prohead protease
MTDLVTLVRVKAVQSDGERFIEGWTTTNQEDRGGDVVEPRGCKFSLPIPLLFQHMHHEPIGAITQATVSEKGIRIRARLSVGVARAEEVWTLIRDGVLTAMSIGFRVLDQKPNGTRGFRITSWEWLESSIVSVPANPGALISVAKCMAMDIKELGSRTQLVSANKRTDPAWIKGIATKGGIDANQIYAACSERSKSWVQTKFKESPKSLPQFAALIAKLAQGLAINTLGRVIDMEKRIAALEGAKSIDADIADDVAKCIERIAELDSATKDRGLKFMGRWNRDVDYHRGEITTHAGALWVASRPTTDAPGACTDWQKMLTADKRGLTVGGEA